MDGPDDEASLDVILDGVPRAIKVALPCENNIPLVG